MTPRRARPTDAGDIARVEAAATPDAWSEGQVFATLTQKTTGAWVLEEDGEVVGHLLASASGPEGELLLVAVHPSHQRRGGARTLLATVEAWWRDQGVEGAFLEVRADNVPARTLYAAHGWTVTGRRPAYYRDGTDALILRWTSARRLSR